MITYLITHFPFLYFTLAMCFIVAGFSLLNYDKILQTVMYYMNVNKEITNELTLQLQIVIRNIDEVSYRQYQLTCGTYLIRTSFVFFAEREYRLHVDKTLAIENKATPDVKSAEIQEAKEVSPDIVNELTDVADIIKMKMNFMSFA